MNFLIPRPLLALTVALLAAFSPGSVLLGKDTSVWLAEKAKETKGGMVLPDKEGSWDFEIADAKGVTIGKKPPGGEDAKSLEFAGTQVLAFRTLKPFPTGAAGFKVSMKVRVSEANHEEDTTILRHFPQWEIRYLHNRKAFLFVIWHDEIHTEVLVPAEPGRWQTLTAEFTPKKMTLVADNEKAEGVPQSPMVEVEKPNFLLLGAAAPQPVEGPLSRPFIGSVADIRITVK